MNFLCSIVHFACLFSVAPPKQSHAAHLADVLSNFFHALCSLPDVFYLSFLNTLNALSPCEKTQLGKILWENKYTMLRCYLPVSGIFWPLFVLCFLRGCALPVLPVGQWCFVTASAVGQGDARSHQSRVPKRQRWKGGEREVPAPFTPRIVTPRSLLALVLQLRLCPAP